MLTFDPLGPFHVWNRLLDKLDISPSRISYSLPHASRPSIPSCRIYDRESAKAFLEKEDERWVEANREQEPDPLDDDLEQAAKPAIRFWMFLIEALDAFRGAEDWLMKASC